MADIFISYAKRHAQLTEDLARDLEAEGFSTWWDTSLLPGDEFPEEIAHEIDAAEAVIVIWTEASVDSAWVRAEANRAHDQGKLITLHAEGLDLGRVPLPFNTLQSAPVTDRAKVFAALARRGVRGSGELVRARPHAPKKSQNYSLMGQAAIAESRADAVAAQEWGRVKQDDIDELRIFAEHFSRTYYGELARKQIKEREREREACTKILHDLGQNPYATPTRHAMKEYLSEFPNGKEASRFRRILQADTITSASVFILLGGLLVGYDWFSVLGWPVGTRELGGMRLTHWGFCLAAAGAILFVVTVGYPSRELQRLRLALGVPAEVAQETRKE